MIKLINDSIFNSKCDLIIIPCNTGGGVSLSIQKELVVNDLPYFHRPVSPGDVSFVQNTGNFSNASIIGYAASVDTSHATATEELLRRIILKIRHYCLNQSVHKINIPLLGTGAGRLDAKKSYEIIQSEFEKDPRFLVCVYTPSAEIYDELTSTNPTSYAELKNPRVFISYTGINNDNRNWVKRFACRLRECGVNARLDMFHLKPGQHLPQWMTNELIMADEVLLICDKYYAEKADNRTGGVGWETMIIQGDMLSNQEQNKYIAILRDSDIDQSLPIYIKSHYALNWSTEELYDREFDDLLFYLFDCDVEPPVGEIPDTIKEKLIAQRRG